MERRVDEGAEMEVRNAFPGRLSHSSSISATNPPRPRALRVGVVSVCVDGVREEEEEEGMGAEEGEGEGLGEEEGEEEEAAAAAASDAQRRRRRRAAEEERVGLWRREERKAEF